MGEFYRPSGFDFGAFIAVFLAALATGVAIIVPYLFFGGDGDDMLKMLFPFAYGIIVAIVLYAFCNFRKIHSVSSAMPAAACGMFLMLLVKVSFGYGPTFLAKLVNSDVIASSVYGAGGYVSELSGLGVSGGYALFTGFFAFVTILVREIAIFGIPLGVLYYKVSSPFSESENIWLNRENISHNFKIEHIDNAMRNEIIENPERIFDIERARYGTITLLHRFVTVRIWTGTNSDENYASFYESRLVPSRSGLREQRRTVIRYLKVSREFCETLVEGDFLPQTARAEGYSGSIDNEPYIRGIIPHNDVSDFGKLVNEGTPYERHIIDIGSEIQSESSEEIDDVMPEINLDGVKSDKK